MDFLNSLSAAAAKLQLKHEWKLNQVKCLESIFEGKDVLAVLPTGYGKSLIFQAVPFLLAARDGTDIECTKNMVIVITPLNSIMEDQCMQLTAKGIKSCYLDFKCTSGLNYQYEDNSEESCIETPTSLNDIKAGYFNIIYAHPETLLCAEGRNLLRSIRKDVCALAIDEAHIVLEW